MRFETFNRPERVLQLKQLCIDRRHCRNPTRKRQSSDSEDVGQLNNDLVTISPAGIDFMRQDDLPVELGFKPV